MLYIRPSAIISEGRVLEDCAVLVEGEQIVAVGLVSEVLHPPEAEELQAGDLLLAPGFIDLQINGAFGSDFTTTPAAIWEIAARLPEYGVTSFLPTIITSPLETIAAAQEVICQGPPSGFRGAVPLGLHLEGPFLNPAKRGAHNPNHLLLPNLPLIERWSPENGVRLVTMAPELPGALDLVRRLRDRGVLVSAGHSLATFDEARAGLEAGVTYGTHLFNAMPPMDHREPGLAGALLTDPRVTVGVIADGVHLHPQMVSLAWKAKGPSGISLVTDAIAALGMPAGNYRLADQEVTVDNTSVRLADGRLAGSVLSLDRAVRNLIEFTGCHTADAIATVTDVPASLLGLASSQGCIKPGFRADIVLLTRDLRVVATLVAGQVVYSTL